MTVLIGVVAWVAGMLVLPAPLAARLRTPAWAVRLVLGEQATLAIGSRRVWPARALASGYSFEFPVLEASLRRRIGDHG